jgi:serine/threonine protein kinase
MGSSRLGAFKTPKRRNMDLIKKMSVFGSKLGMNTISFLLFFAWHPQPSLSLRPLEVLQHLGSDFDDLNLSATGRSGPSAELNHDTSEQDDLVGTIFVGRYQLDSILGTGGMGVVYKGRQIFLDRPVAIKLLKAASIPAKARQRFHQEAKAASTLGHPGVVSVIDFGVDELDRPYMVMEYVEGCTLSELLAERLVLSTEDVLPVFLEICDALGAAHKKGIVHRDIKPANIMLVIGDDDEVRVKILDFGIAKTVDFQDNTVQNLTKTGDALGTPLYMSPEQVNSKNVTTQSDLYSLGCTLYACLTGTPPFVGENKMATMDMHCTEKPLSLKEASEGLDFPLGIEGIVMRLLEKKPENRFADVGQLKEALIEMARRNNLLPPAEPYPVAGGSPPSGNDSAKISDSISHSVHRSRDTHTRLSSANSSVSGTRSEKLSQNTQQNSTEQVSRQKNTSFWQSDLSERMSNSKSGKAGGRSRERGGGESREGTRGRTRAKTEGQTTTEINEQFEDEALEPDSSRKKAFLIVGSSLALAVTVGAYALHAFLKPTLFNGVFSMPSKATVQSNKKTADASHLNVGVGGASVEGKTPGPKVTEHNGGSDVSQDMPDVGDDLAPPVKESFKSADKLIESRIAAGSRDTILDISGMKGLTQRGLKNLTRFKSLTDLDLSNTGVTDADVNIVANMKLETLVLDNDHALSDWSIFYASRIPTLKTLCLAATGVTDAGLRYLDSLKSLRAIVLSGNRQITDIAIKNLKPASSNIYALDLSGCNVSDACAEEVAKFRSLQLLSIADNPRITDNAVGTLLRKAPNLQKLYLSDDNITDSGIRDLTRFKELKHLVLSGIQLSPKAVAELSTMQQLEYLEIADCGLPDSAIASLKQKLPDTEISLVRIVLEFSVH